MAPAHLADLPSSHRFWQDHDEFRKLALQPGVRDRNFDGTSEQVLTPNKILTLALNELAAANRMGFFWHLPSRNSTSHEEFEPPSRKPAGAG